MIPFPPGNFKLCHIIKWPYIYLGCWSLLPCDSVSDNYCCEGYNFPPLGLISWLCLVSINRYFYLVVVSVNHDYLRLVWYHLNCLTGSGNNSLYWYFLFVMLENPFFRRLRLLSLPIPRYFYSFHYFYLCTSNLHFMSKCEEYEKHYDLGSS